MSIDEIRSLRNAQPFRPFEIIMADGRAISVVDRLRLGIAPWGKIGVYEGARLHLLAPAEIVEIRVGTSAGQ